MAGEDVPIWERFLDLRGPEFIGFVYDARVGQGIAPPPGMSPELIKVQFDNTAKRIDAIGVRSGELWIIEVRRRFGLSSIGQVLGYTVLAADDLPAELSRRVVIVTDNMGRDEKTITDKLGIEVVVV